MSKRCAYCDQKKALSAFGVNKARSDGVNSYCRPCFNVYGRRLAWVQRLEALVHYSGDPPSCACCGETLLEFLAIDHIAGGGRQHMKKIGHRLVRWLRREGYPEGFRVLCHNCNFAIGHYGYCPHHSASVMTSEIEKFKGEKVGSGNRRRCCEETC